MVVNYRSFVSNVGKMSEGLCVVIAKVRNKSQLAARSVVQQTCRRTLNYLLNGRLKVLCQNLKVKLHRLKLRETSEENEMPF